MDNDNLQNVKYSAFRDAYGNIQPMSIKDWLVTYLLLCIPIANFIFAIIWAIGGENIHPDKQNYFRAYWIVCAICLLISIVIWFLLFMCLIAIFM